MIVCWNQPRSLEQKWWEHLRHGKPGSLSSPMAGLVFIWDSHLWSGWSNHSLHQVLVFQEEKPNSQGLYYSDLADWVTCRLEVLYLLTTIISKGCCISKDKVQWSGPCTSSRPWYHIKWKVSFSSKSGDYFHDFPQPMTTGQLSGFLCPTGYQIPNFSKLGDPFMIDESYHTYTFVDALKLSSEA